MGSNKYTEDECYVFGGGTVSHIRNHLALSAPAYGSSAKFIASQMRLGNPPFDFYPPKVNLVLTKMADSSSKLETTQDVSDYIDKIIQDKNTRIIFFSCAICDFFAQIEGISGSHEERLSSKKEYSLILKPAEKIIQKIKKERSDIFLVGFKTTTSATSQNQVELAREQIFSAGCNLVFANDVVERNNIIVDKDTVYLETKQRKEALQYLVDLTKNKIAAGTYEWFSKH